MKENEEFYLGSSDRGFLSTADAAGRPTVVPVCFAYESDIIYIPIDDKPKRSGNLARLKNLSSRQSAAFIVDSYSQDWTRLSYLLVHGRGRVVKGETELSRAKTLLRRKYPQYLSMSLDIRTVIALDVEESKFWAFQPR